MTWFSSIWDSDIFLAFNAGMFSELVKSICSISGAMRANPGRTVDWNGAMYASHDMYVLYTDSGFSVKEQTVVLGFLEGEVWLRGK